VAVNNSKPIQATSDESRELTNVVKLGNARCSYLLIENNSECRSKAADWKLYISCMYINKDNEE
jgi:hypothetical protein